jgi:hypothetical protein
LRCLLDIPKPLLSNSVAVFCLQLVLLFFLFIDDDLDVPARFYHSLSMISA